MKQRFMRVGDAIADDTTLVIRGGELESMLRRADSLRNHEIYGTYGLSVLAMRAGLSALLLCDRSVVEIPYYEQE